MMTDIHWNLNFVVWYSWNSRKLVCHKLL